MRWMLVVLFGCTNVGSQHLGAGRYAITADGPNRSEIVALSYREAARVCPRGYDVVDADRETREDDVSFDGGKTNARMRRSSAALIVQCRMPPPPPPAPVVTQGPPGGNMTTAARWWCFYMSSSRVGTCDRFRDNCVEFREKMAMKHAGLSPCEPQIKAACFDVRINGSRTFETCHHTMESCVFSIDSSRTSADTEVRSECRWVE